MDIEFSLTKSVEENAGTYFDAAKKAKKKLEGAKKALAETKKQLAKVEKDEAAFWVEEEKKQKRQARKKEWYEKFHWFFSSEDILCIGGKDATTNEIIVKKHMEADDLVFHTEMAGSPFFIVKSGKQASDQTLEQAAQATACYSRAWKLGQASAEVFYVTPEQVSKEAESGEYMSKGSFMVRGKRVTLKPRLEYAIGVVEEEIIGGPVEAVKAKTKIFVLVVPGREKKSALAKKIISKLKVGHVDDIVSFLPSGGGDLKK